MTDRDHQAWRALESGKVFICLTIVLFLTLIGWSMNSMVARVVRVDGRVIPSAKNQVIQHLDGGIVASILVSEGQTVHKGDVLLSIDDTKASSNLASSQIKLKAMMLKAIRLRCEAERCPRPAYSKEDMRLAETGEELMLFDIRSHKLDQEIQTYREQLKQQSAELEQNANHLAHTKEELATAEHRLKLTANLVANKAASELEMLDAKERVERLTSELDQAQGNRPKTLSTIAQIDSKIRESENKFRADARGDLSTLLPDIDRLSHEISDSTAQFSRTDVRSPVEGIVNKLHVSTIGGVIRPGEVVAEITPAGDKLAIEGAVRPQDRGYLVVGQRAMVRVSAYDAAALGPITGRLAEISPDTIADARGLLSYRTMIQVDHLPDQYRDHSIVPGMTVTADVVTGERSVISYLTAPVRKFNAQIFRDTR